MKSNPFGSKPKPKNEESNKVTLDAINAKAKMILAGRK